MGRVSAPSRSANSAREERERRRLQRTGASTPPLPPPLVDPALSATAPSSESIFHVAPPTVEPEVAEPYVPPKQPSVTPAPLPARQLPVMSVPLPARQPPVTPAPLPASSNLYRPHLYRKQAQGSRGFAARAGIVLALMIVLGALGFGAVLLSHHSARPKIPPIPQDREDRHTGGIHSRPDRGARTSRRTSRQLPAPVQALQRNRPRALRRAGRHPQPRRVSVSRHL